ncbi:MAG: AraC family transcriptional regulator [Spirochaetaceae bacterium]|nr:AraC family transcriptional regulator [Spirochaetaceae bacterium]
MFDAIYGFLRGAVGFSLLVAGGTILLSHPKERGLRAFAALYLACGALFTMSALDPLARLPLDLDNLLFQTLIFVLGWSLLEMALYLFGNERHRGSRRRLVAAGLAYEAALVLLPLLDYVLKLEPAIRNVEDGLARGPIHAAAAVAAYAWPIAATAVSLAIARWQPGDLSGGRPESRRFLAALAGVGVFLAAILVFLALSLRVPYRVGHLLLEIILVALYFYVVKNPRVLTKLRTEIGKEHERRLVLGDEEAADIARKLESLVRSMEFIGDEKLDLRSLAARIGVPAYRLSSYFGSRLATTFPAWRNKQRIAYVKRRMTERPDLTILEISVEAGYTSKATFNTQFSRSEGMSPSEFRRKLANGLEKVHAAE